MEQVTEILQKCLSEHLLKVVVSNKRKADLPAKIIIRPFEQGGEIKFQFEEHKNNQVFHYNYAKEEAIRKILGHLPGDYKQLDLFTDTYNYSVLVSKKGKSNIKRRPAQGFKKIELSHNRKKKYILPEHEAVSFLIDLGVQTKDGNIIPKKTKKWKQINRFLEFVEDVLPALPKDREITILDFGCGKSYLTFAMYYYLKILKQYHVRMIGLDLKSDVIRHCNQLAEKYGYKELKFLEGDISSYEGVDQVDMVVTLHACDTATDFALDKAIRWGAKVILSVPCCQHEMNQQIHNELLEPVLKYGILKERISALLTDGLRANILEQKGYDVQLLEFIDMEDTPKNLLIRAVRKENKGQKKNKDSYMRLCQALNFRGTLEELQKKD